MCSCAIRSCSASAAANCSLEKACPQLAQDVGVNTMTVNKAYTALKNEGYIEIDRRHGARVSPAVRLDGEFREKLEGELALLIAESGLKGMEKQDFLTLCGQIFDQMSGLHPTAQGV